MNKIACILLLIISLIIATSCSNHDGKSCTPINRFEAEVINYPHLTTEQQTTFINQYTEILTILNQSIKADSISELPTIIPTTPIYKSFISDVTNTFATTDTLSQTLYQILDQYAKETATTIPQVSTYITPYNQSIILSDQYILIALNHYLGSNHPSYTHLSDEIKINKHPNRIPYDIAESLLRNQYSNDYLLTTQSTLLDHILYEGFIINSIQQLHPSFQLTTALGYTAQQLEWSRKNSQQIWQKLISSDLLYTTQPFEISKLINPTPYTANISSDSPGKLGIWIGTQIITSYINAESISSITSLYEKLKTTDNQTILMQSQYYGK